MLEESTYKHVNLQVTYSKSNYFVSFIYKNLLLCMYAIITAYEESLYSKRIYNNNK